MRVSMLTTIDNPYDPFTQFDDWFAFDTQKGYNSCDYLANLVYSASELSSLDQNIAVESAIDRIVKLNLLGIYKKVTKEINSENWETSQIKT